MSIDPSETPSHIERKQVSSRDTPCKSAVGGQKCSKSVAVKEVLDLLYMPLGANPTHGLHVDVI